MRSSAAIAAATGAVSCSASSLGVSACSTSTAARCSSGVAALRRAATARFTSTSAGSASGRKTTPARRPITLSGDADADRSEEHTSELQSRQYLVCRLRRGKKKTHEQQELTI